MRICSALAILLVCPMLLDCGRAQADLLYMIGNSLTANTLPSTIGPNVGYHIDYGDTLSTIYNNPGGHGLINVRPAAWNVALANNQYDFVSVQPYWSSYPPKNVPAISHWVNMQPNAAFVLHSPWPNVPDNGPGILARFNKSYPWMNKQDAALLSQLRAKFPGHQFLETHSLDALKSIAVDVAAGVAPVDLRDIYASDDLHMSDIGEYMMSNLVRGTIGLKAVDWKQLGIDGENVDPSVWNYLDSKVAEFYPEATSGVPEPSSLVLLALVGVGYAGWHSLQRRRTVGAATESPGN